MGTCMAANTPDDFELFQSVRQNQPQITSLSFCNRPQLTSLDPLKYFPNLRSLRIDRCQNVRHLIPTVSFLAAGLSSLSIPFSSVVDLDGMQNLKELEVFNVCGYDSQIQSVKHLIGLPLRYLNLGGKSQVRDLEYIQLFPRLERLNLSGVFFNENINYPPLTILSSLNCLTHLDLSIGPMINDLSPVFKINTLESLILTGMQKKTAGIENLKNIEYLALGMLCNNLDPSCFSKFSKLKKIQASPYSEEKLAMLKKHLDPQVEITEQEDDFPGWDW